MVGVASVTYLLRMAEMTSRSRRSFEAYSPRKLHCQYVHLRPVEAENDLKMLWEEKG